MIRPKRKRSGRSSNDAHAVVAGIRITHPNRVLFREQNLTKLDLATYFEHVADWILPHVANRPLTLVRCPTGPAGQCFYQKHLSNSLPDVVRGVTIQEEDSREQYVVIDDLSGLISLIQMGVLEFHPWPARADDVERPDRLVFDLDPGEGVQWNRVVEAAGHVRDLLQTLGLTSFLRTSGGRGLHVVVPLVRRTTWDELKQFAKNVADRLIDAMPTRYIATMSKVKRRGKVFIDYLRNQRGATAIASYSTRARVGAPVAMPLAWEELGGRIKANSFRVDNVPERLERSDPWKDFLTIRQSITNKMMATVEG
jgi:bifunctional non-homologous end joining protein LigD